MTVQSKAELRRSLLKVRRSLSVETWQTQSRQLCHQLQASLPFRQADTVLAYFSFRQEPDLSTLFDLKKVWGFPRCVDQALDWHVWSPQAALPLQTGAYGILEPDANAPNLLASQVDLILVPAVACDRRGYRLGYGGGFYDRLLSTPDWAEKPTIGIVFDFARLEQLPDDPWDRPLGAVCTEAGFFPTSAK